MAGAHARSAVVVAIGALVFGAPQAAGAATTVALWHMDEALGATSMVDSSGNNNNGVPVGTAFGQPGVFGSAYGFDGSTSSVTVPDSTTLDPGASDFSFTLNVNFSAIPATDYDLLRKGVSSTAGGHYKVEILKKKHGTVAEASCHYGGSRGTAGILAKTNLADGLWHSITCTKTSGSISITVDGATKLKSVTIGSISNAMPLWLGAKFKGTRGADHYAGLMDEVSVQLP